MNIELEKQRNELLHRTNVIAKIRSAKTPNRKELLKQVAATMGVDEKLIVIDKITPNFGEHIISAYIKVYDEVKYLKEIELEYKIKRTGEIEEPKPEVEEPKEEAKEEEKPAEATEEVKEEKAEEEKKEE